MVGRGQPASISFSHQGLIRSSQLVILGQAEVCAWLEAAPWVAGLFSVTCHWTGESCVKTATGETRVSSPRPGMTAGDAARWGHTDRGLGRSHTPSPNFSCLH